MKYFPKKIVLSLVLLISLQCPLISQGHNKTKVTIQHGKISLIKLIDILKKQTGYSFAYDCKLIDPNKMVICDFPPNSDIETILNQSLPTSIAYKQKGNHIILFSTRPVAKITAITTKAISVATPIINIKPIIITQEAKRDTIQQPTSVVVKDISIHPSIEKYKTDSIKSIQDTPTVRKDTLRERINPTTHTKNIANKTIADTLTTKKNNLIVELELAGYNKLGCVSTRIGYKKIYSLISYSLDFKSANWMGAGMGCKFPLLKKIELSTELSYNKLIGGDSFKNGLTASTLQLKPILSYELFGFLKIIVGPEVYLLTKKLTDPSTSQVIKASPSYGYGVYFGTRIDLNRLFLSQNIKFQN